MLETIWFFVVGISLFFYTALDGFDLGVGILHLFARDDQERRVFLNAIGPVWDGNEVWLVIVGGGLFAGFPNVYATVFSAFYTPLMALLCGLILRAVAIEFRSKVEHWRWRRVWDIVFSLSSHLIAFLTGIVLGSLVQGIPLDPYGNFTGELKDFFSPFTILLGLTVTALCAMHGNLFLLMKTEGPLHHHMRGWVKGSITIFIVMYMLLTAFTLHRFPYMLDRMFDHPIFFVVPLLTLIGILAIPCLVHRDFAGWAFISSCFSILMLFSLFGIGTYPTMVLSTLEPATRSLTVSNSHASENTLRILLIIAGIGVPLVLAYGTYIYRIFRGKVRLDDTSY